MMLTSKLAPARARDDAGHGGGRGRDQAGRDARARMLMTLVRVGRASGGIRGSGGVGGTRARARVLPPARPSLPPAQ